MKKNTLKISARTLEAARRDAIARTISADAIAKAKAKAEKAEAKAEAVKKIAAALSQAWRDTVTADSPDGDRDAKAEAKAARDAAHRAEADATEARAEADALTAAGIERGNDIIISFRAMTAAEAEAVRLSEALTAAREKAHAEKATAKAEAEAVAAVLTARRNYDGARVTLAAAEAARDTATTPAEALTAARRVLSARDKYARAARRLTEAEAEAVEARRLSCRLGYAADVIADADTVEALTAEAEAAAKAARTAEAKAEAEAAPRVSCHVGAGVLTGCPTAPLSIGYAIARDIARHVPALASAVIGVRYDTRTAPHVIDTAARAAAYAAVKATARRQGTPLQWRLYVTAARGQWFNSDLFDIYSAAAEAYAIATARADTVEALTTEAEAARAALSDLLTLSAHDTTARAAVLTSAGAMVSDDTRATLSRVEALETALTAATEADAAKAADYAAHAAYRFIGVYLSSIRGIREDATAPALSLDDDDTRAAVETALTWDYDSVTEYDRRRRFAIIDTVAAVLPSLTPIQLEVMRVLFRTGGDTTAAARILRRSRATIRGHRAAIARKLSEAAPAGTLEASLLSIGAAAAEAEAEATDTRTPWKKYDAARAAEAARVNAPRRTDKRRAAAYAKARRDVPTPATVTTGTAPAALTGDKYAEALTAARAALTEAEAARLDVAAVPARVNAAYDALTAAEAKAKAAPTRENDAARDAARVVYAARLTEAPAIIARARAAEAKADTLTAKARRLSRAEAVASVTTAAAAHVTRAALTEAARRARREIIAEAAAASRAEAKAKADAEAEAEAVTRDAEAAVLATVAAAVVKMSPVMRETARDAARGVGVRESARLTGRHPSTVSEARKRAAAIIRDALTEAATTAAEAARDALTEAARVAEACPLSVFALIES